MLPEPEPEMSKSARSQCSSSEQRYQLIGAVFARIILVAHSIRVDIQTGSTEEEPVIRIISARKATQTERKLYEEKAAD